MAGKTGFIHSCNDVKIKKGSYHLSLKESGFTDAQIKILWDFYVSRSFAASTGDPISLETCGWHDTQSKTDGLPVLESALAAAAGLASFCIIRNKTIRDTLGQMDLSNERICVSHSRAVLAQSFTYESDENETIKIKSAESRINAIFRHIRNSFAHGNTYFFPNGNCLLIDKDGSKTTAAILIPKESLWDWIAIVDKSKAYYNL
jgi:hypothetical protein